MVEEGQCIAYVGAGQKVSGQAVVVCSGYVWAGDVPAGLVEQFKVFVVRKRRGGAVCGDDGVVV